MGGTAKTTTAMSIAHKPANMTFIGDRIFLLRKMVKQTKLLRVPKMHKTNIAKAQLYVQIV